MTQGLMAIRENAARVLKSPGRAYWITTGALHAFIATENCCIKHGFGSFACGFLLMLAIELSPLEISWRREYLWASLKAATVRAQFFMEGSAGENAAETDEALLR